MKTFLQYVNLDNKFEPLLGELWLCLYLCIMNFPTAHRVKNSQCQHFTITRIYPTANSLLTMGVRPKFFTLLIQCCWPHQYHWLLQVIPQKENIMKKVSKPSLVWRQFLPPRAHYQRHDMHRSNASCKNENPTHSDECIQIPHCPKTVRELNIWNIGETKWHC